MVNKIIFTLIGFIVPTMSVFSQITDLNVSQYLINLTVSDRNDSIYVQETVIFTWENNNQKPFLNLTSVKKKGNLSPTKMTPYFYNHFRSKKSLWKSSLSMRESQLMAW